jgi:anti-sigma regulatory factor (Ser/Thr protein kinase)
LRPKPFTRFKRYTSWVFDWVLKEASAITKQRSVIDLKLESRLSATREVRAAVDHVAETCRLPQEDRFALKLAATEAVTNALKAGEPPVEVTIACEGDAVDINVENASVFKPESHSDPTPASDFEGGRGIPIMIALVDEIEFARSGAGSRVRMRRRVHPAGEGDSPF